MLEMSESATRSDAKVDDAGTSLSCVSMNVRRFDVAVDDAARVRVVQRLGTFENDLDGRRRMR